ncbi:MAG: DUF4268 domain-containing protein [Marinifilaceae bacterium]|jgi:hypothetical protein
MYTKEEAREMRLAFWDGFKRYSKKSGRKMTSWVLKGTQIREAQLKFDCSEKEARVSLQIDHKFDESRLQVYQRFEKYRPVINDTCGEELIWNPNFYIEGFKEVSLIYYQLDGVSIYRKEQWEQIYAFFVEKMTLLEEAFLDVKDVVRLSEM